MMKNLFYIFVVAAFGINAGIVANDNFKLTDTLLISSWDDEDEDEDDGWIACKEHEEENEGSEKTDSQIASDEKEDDREENKEIAKCSNGQCSSDSSDYYYPTEQQPSNTGWILAQCSNGKCSVNVDRLKQEKAEQQEQDCSQGNCQRV